MDKKLPDLIYELSKICFERHLILSIESITDKKGQNTITHLNDVVNIIVYSSDEEDKRFSNEISLLIESLKTTP